MKYIDLFGNVLSDFTSLRTLNELVLRGTNLSGSIPQTGFERKFINRWNSWCIFHSVEAGEAPSQWKQAWRPDSGRNREPRRLKGGHTFWYPVWHGGYHGTVEPRGSLRPHAGIAMRYLDKRLINPITHVFILLYLD